MILNHIEIIELSSHSIIFTKIDRTSDRYESVSYPGLVCSLAEVLLLENIRIREVRMITNDTYFTVGESVHVNNVARPYTIANFKFYPGNGDMITIQVMLEGTSSHVALRVLRKIPVPVMKKEVKESKDVKINFDFPKLETLILKENPRQIRFEKFNKKRTETPLEFMQKIFTDLNQNKSTIFVDTKEVQTDIGRRRSLGDLFMLMKYYYPEITLKEVVVILHTKLPKLIKGFRSSWCNQINKRTYYFDASQKTEVLNLTRRDEYGNLYPSYCSKNES